VEFTICIYFIIIKWLHFSPQVEIQSLVNEDLHTLLIPSILWLKVNHTIICDQTTDCDMSVVPPLVSGPSVHWGSVVSFSFGPSLHIPIDHKTINTVHLRQDSCSIFQPLENQFTASNSPVVSPVSPMLAPQNDCWLRTTQVGHATGTQCMLVDCWYFHHPIHI
jgi:hypothetical protein